MVERLPSTEVLPVGVRRLSCLPCQKRKSRCDRAQPCATCVVQRTEGLCYAPVDVQQDSESAGEINLTKPPTRKRKRTKGVRGQSRGDEGSKVNDVAVEDKEETAMLSAVGSMRSSLESLESMVKNKHAVRNSSWLLQWHAVCHLFPPLKDTEMILDAFFSEVNWIFARSHRGMFLQEWQSFVIDGKPSSRSFIALTFFLMASTMVFVPRSHPVHRLPWRKDCEAFVKRGYDVLHSSESVLRPIAESLEYVQAQYHLCLTLVMCGWTAAAEVEIGTYLRLSRALELFEEERWSIRQMSDWEIELSRRLASEALIMDRHSSLHYLRRPVFPLEYKSRPDFFDDSCYDIKTGKLDRTNAKHMTAAQYHRAKAISSVGAHQVCLFLRKHTWLSKTEHYEATWELDKVLERLQRDALAEELDFEQFKTVTNRSLFGSAAQSLHIYTGFLRQRCSIARQFLFDSEAPIELQALALRHAREVIEVLPVLINVASDPSLAFCEAWCSRHIFCGAGTFVLAHLEGDMKRFPAELDWFVRTVPKIIEGLSILGVRDRVSKRCQELLTALCSHPGVLCPDLVRRYKGQFRGADEWDVCNASKNKFETGLDRKNGHRNALNPTESFVQKPCYVETSARSTEQQPSDHALTSAQAESHSISTRTSTDLLCTLDEVSSSAKVPEMSDDQMDALVFSLASDDWSSFFRRPND